MISNFYLTFSNVKRLDFDIAADSAFHKTIRYPPPPLSCAKKSPSTKIEGRYGGEYRTRTCHPLRARQMLYQMS